MNADDRKRLAEIIERLEGCAADVREISEALQERYDNAPEGLQGTEQTEKLSDQSQNLENAASDIDNAVESVREEMEG